MIIVQSLGFRFFSASPFRSHCVQIENLEELRAKGTMKNNTTQETKFKKKTNEERTKMAAI